jgi:hypothetical protein
VPVTGIREEKQGLPDWEIHNLESTLIVLLTREQKENNKKTRWKRAGQQTQARTSDNKKETREDKRQKMEERQDSGQTQLTRKRANSRTQSQDDKDGTQDHNREFHNDQCSLFALVWGRRVNVKT